MKKRIILGLLVLVLLSQIPFAYRRYRLTRLRTAIQTLNGQRVPAELTDYVDYHGVIHVHTFLGGHSTGTFSELIAAAKADRLDFVIMTEHPDAEFNSAAMTLNGIFGGVLFIGGNEVVTSSGDRLLLIPGRADASRAGLQSTLELVAQQKRDGGLSIAAYPAESHGWQASAVEGIEVYNLFVNARQTNKTVLLFDGLWSYRSYADLMFANFFSRPSENLRLWDELIAGRTQRVIAIAGNDAHSNVGFSVNDETGKQLLGLKADPYERSFRTVSTHLFVAKDKPLSRETIIEALTQGHAYISFDLFADPNGFSFTSSGPPKISGDEVAFQNGMQLTVKTPLVSRIVLFRDGAPIEERTGSQADFPAPKPGVYRVECYLDSLPRPARGKPWIISNPIYVR